MTARARVLRAEGKDVINLAAGEPDFNTPEPVCRAAADAMAAGQTKYTPSSGTPQLRAAVAAKFGRENRIIVQPDQVVVSCGAKHSVYNAMQVLVNPGDEVLLLAPYWMTYADQVRLAGGVPVIVHPELGQAFPSAEAVRAATTAKTKMLVVNSPSNPTGAAMTPEQLKELAELAVDRGLWLVSDEIYERLVYDGHPHVSPASFGPEVAERTVTVSGCSKTYAMTGWRIGYAAAPLHVAKAMACLQDQVTSNPTSFAQAGAIAALELPPDAVESMRAEFQARRDLVLGLLGESPGIRTAKPQGAFYVFPNVSKYLGGQVASDVQLADRLLEDAGVATVPGSVFEGPGHLRISYAASREDLERGIGRILGALSRLS